MNVTVRANYPDGSMPESVEVEWSGNQTGVIGESVISGELLLSVVDRLLSAPQRVAFATPQSVTGRFCSREGCGHSHVRGGPVPSASNAGRFCAREGCGHSQRHHGVGACGLCGAETCPGFQAGTVWAAIAGQKLRPGEVVTVGADRLLWLAPDPVPGGGRGRVAELMDEGDGAVLIEGEWRRA